MGPDPDTASSGTPKTELGFCPAKGNPLLNGFPGGGHRSSAIVVLGEVEPNAQLRAFSGRWVVLNPGFPCQTRDERGKWREGSRKTVGPWTRVSAGPSFPGDGLGRTSRVFTGEIWGPGVVRGAEEGKVEMGNPRGNDR